MRADCLQREKIKAFMVEVSKRREREHKTRLVRERKAEEEREAREKERRAEQQRRVAEAEFQDRKAKAAALEKEREVNVLSLASHHKWISILPAQCGLYTCHITSPVRLLLPVAGMIMRVIMMVPTHSYQQSVSSTSHLSSASPSLPPCRCR
jgi:hypothetical protein